MKHGLCLLLVFLLGCTSLTPERIGVISAIAGQAAQLGIQLWLEQHPTHRKAVEFTVQEFANGVKEGKTNPVPVLHRLPTSSLAGPHGDVYVSGDRLVVWDAELNKGVAATGEAEKPVLREVLAGLKRGVATMPPKLPVRVKREIPHHGAISHPIPIANSGAVDNPIPLTDAQLDAQFEAVKAMLAERTNTVSTVDVQPTPNGASVVTVRWHGRPGVYCVQQRDEGSVEWIHLGYATNAAEWSTGWHPSLPVGHWRVTRLK